MNRREIDQFIDRKLGKLRNEAEQLAWLREENLRRAWAAEAVPVYEPVRMLKGGIDIVLGGEKLHLTLSRLEKIVNALRPGNQSTRGAAAPLKQATPRRGQPVCARAVFRCPAASHFPFCHLPFSRPCRAWQGGRRTGGGSLIAATSESLLSDLSCAAGLLFTRRRIETLRYLCTPLISTQKGGPCL